VAEQRAGSSLGTDQDWEPDAVLPVLGGCYEGVVESLAVGEGLCMCCEGIGQAFGLEVYLLQYCKSFGKALSVLRTPVVSDCW
jgi:hypothetical protein